MFLEAVYTSAAYRTIAARFLFWNHVRNPHGPEARFCRQAQGSLLGPLAFGSARARPSSDFPPAASAPPLLLGEAPALGLFGLLDVVFPGCLGGRCRFLEPLDDGLQMKVGEDLVAKPKLP